MTEPEPPRPHANALRRRLAATGVTLAALALMVLTEPGLAIVWDEGYTLGREARVRTWLRGMRDPATLAGWRPPAVELVQPDDPSAAVPPPPPESLRTRAGLLSRPALLYFWPFAREEPHGHPPFYAIVGLIGDLAAPGRPDLPRARLGPMLAFSLAAGAIAAAVGKRYGPWAAAVAVGAWVLHPHLFAHGHYATVDAILASLWVGGLIAFAEAARVDGAEESRRRGPRWAWAVAFGVLCGWAAGTKLTGWFLPIPCIAWALLARDRRGLLTLAAGGIVAILTLYVFTPPWWGAPVEGVARFLRSNLTRGRTIPIPVLFLGTIYNTPVDSLPWYNTIAWTAMATPVGFMAFALIGGARTVGGRALRSFAAFAALHWLFLLTLRALPHTPGHDGTRQFLPAFGPLALLAGAGAGWVVSRWQRAGRVAVVAALAEGVAGVGLMMPVPLSYYSPAVGGLPGARSIGMEPTYFWDALGPEAVSWLDRHSGQDARILFSTNPTSWMYLQRKGVLPWAITPESSGGPPAWYVLQNRPGAFRPFERDLIKGGSPAFVLSKSGVPLLWVFPYDEVESFARRAEAPR